MIQIPESLTCEDNGVEVVVWLAAVSGLDALDYRRALGSELDAALWSMANTATAEDFTVADWSLADRAVLCWLWARHNIDARAPLADVVAGVRMIYVSDPADEAGVVDAPEVAV